jgi:hypothetical protein
VKKVRWQEASALTKDGDESEYGGKRVVTVRRKVS